MATQACLGFETTGVETARYCACPRRERGGREPMAQAGTHQRSRGLDCEATKRSSLEVDASAEGRSPQVAEYRGRSQWIRRAGVDDLASGGSDPAPPWSQVSSSHDERSIARTGMESTEAHRTSQPAERRRDYRLEADPMARAKKKPTKSSPPSCGG